MLSDIRPQICNDPGLRVSRLVLPKLFQSWSLFPYPSSPGGKELIYSFNKYSLGVYYVLEIILDDEWVARSKTDKKYLFLWGLHFSRNLHSDNKQKMHYMNY
jgi:hypothetical protein